MPKFCSYILPIILISTFSASADEVVSFYKDLKSDDLKKVKFYNPKPDPDDVIVSLPCDLKMAFRKVYTSTGTDKLQDNTFVAGDASDSSLSQGAHLRHIQGGFKDDKGYYYLVAKYELLKFQAEAIRNNGVCPKITPKNRIPVTNISYFDALDIARQMTLYIQGLGGTKNTLLQQDSFVRMLTDAEWEFAARGGLNVTKEQLSESIPAFNGEELRDIAWYQGPQSSNGRVQLPGLKKPNPLKIYDMLGNVQEMVNDFFNPVNKQRISGQVGGICVRGGSFLTPAQRMSSALRTERPLINPQNHKEAKSLDMGTRFTLAPTAVFNDVEEVKQLNKEFSNEKDPASALASQVNLYHHKWFYIAIITLLVVITVIILLSKRKNACSMVQYIIGYMYQNGRGIKKDCTKAFKWYKRSAEQEYVRAQCKIGNMYYYGEGVKQDFFNALKWYKKAVKQGFAKAQYNLANMYCEGQGVKRDYIEAVEWYKKASEQRFAPAQCELANLYREGQGVKQDYVEAVMWYKKAAEQGFAKAQYNLANMFCEGQGVKQDYIEAVVWYKKAAEQGFAPAQCELANLYREGHEGQGVKQDYVEAVEWYKKAAEQGFAPAQCELAIMYSEGLGVKQDYIKAVEWYKKAAEQGYSRAQHNLALMYVDGQGWKII